MKILDINHNSKIQSVVQDKTILQPQSIPIQISNISI